MKLIIHARPGYWIMGVRSAQWLQSLGPDQKDGIIAYEDGTDFYVKRNGPDSITARQIAKEGR